MPPSLRFIAVALLGTLSITAQAQGPDQTLSFTSTTAEFLNPERGFMRFTNLTDPWSYPQIRSDGQTIVYGRVDASSFRNQPLSQGFLNQIQSGFDAARTNGLKVKFRLAYNNGFDPDAPKSVMLGHIQQLAPLWNANKDVIFHLDAGFIGAWGEWHSSTNGLDTPANRAEILGAILDAVPVDRTVGIRTPHFKREIFGGSQVSDSAVITEANAFDGSDLSRVGHLNDCFLSSPTDVGTYINPGGVWPVSRELDYIGGESQFVPMGGETCALHARSESPAALAEMETLHIDYLNLDYHPDVINRWQSQGSFDEIQRRLGYRFELDTATVPTTVQPGGLMPVEFTIDNVGFGELFNPRDVEVTLRNNTTGEIITAPLSVDPRFWAGGETNTVAAQLVLPNDMALGNYSVGLWMPDHEASLRNDTRYAIRFANTGVWDAATGINVLTTSFTVAASTAGPVFVGLDSFAEVADLSTLTLAGDFNRDGTVDAADYTVWRDNQGATVTNPYDGADGDGDGTIGSGDYDVWQDNFGATLPSAAAAIPEPTAVALLATLSVPAFLGRRRS